MWLLSNLFGYMMAGIIGGAVCILFSNNFLKFLHSLRVRFNLRSIKIIEITNREQCHAACLCIKSHCKDLSALGFDCEWRTVNRIQRPVALLQLATVHGLCCLFRLNILQEIPEEIQDILCDPKIIKLGIDPLGDSKQLLVNYKVKVFSTLDLRNLFQENKSLASLAADEIGLKLNKSTYIRCSNWETPELTNSQKDYAAKDAFAAVEIFKKWLLTKNKTLNFLETKSNAYELLYEKFKPEISRYLDIKFSQKSISNSPIESNKKAQRSNILNQNKLPKDTTVRKSPLYDSCFMHAPDGELLCSCDKRKAEWYMSRGLAEVIPGEPFSIRLLFEPAGRADKNHGRFYQQLKQNCCVVCGASDSYLRHNVVPKEYRKHFPKIMKEHQSHDVVLMCIICHQMASRHNEALRQELAEKCQAPIHTSKQTTNTEIVNVKNCAKALLTAGDRIPEERKINLQNIIKKYTQVSEVTPEILQEVVKLKSRTACFDMSESHGIKVVNYYIKNSGLTELEILWRTHFLDTMRPQFLPALWSITHNHERVTANLNKNDSTI